jgi:Ca-activated chloride channel family protein
MSFAWPEALLGLLAVAALAALYWGLRSRRQLLALRYSSTGLLREAAEAPSWRRHAPAGFYLLSLAVMFVALARPTTTIWSPAANATVLLVIDVSGSMRSADIAPTRLQAAESAATEFVQKQPKGVKIGLVAFSEVAFLVTPPTEDRKEVIQALGALSLGRGTNIGDGLRAGEIALLDPEASAASLRPSSSAGQFNLTPPDAETAVIVLLSDGAATTGPDPLAVADEIAQSGIRVFTVGLGTNAPDAFSPVPSGPAQFGRGRFMELDEPTLRGIAETTGGEYFNAQSSGQLRKIYGELGSRAHLEREKTEVTFIATGIALLLMVCGAVASMLWSSRLP